MLVVNHDGELLETLHAALLVTLAVIKLCPKVGVHGDGVVVTTSVGACAADC